MTSALRLIIGFSPGSASDQIARTIAPGLSRILGRPVHIEPHPGGNGAPAAALAAGAPGDGNTLFVATLGTHALAPHLDPGLPYSPTRDFAPVSLVSRSPLVLARGPALDVNTVRELIDFAQAHPNAITYGTSAIGGAPHLAAELFQHMAGVELRHVRYDETERLYDDLEAGRVSLTFNNAMSAIPRSRSGRVMALAVTSGEPIAAAPALEPVAQTLPGYEVTNWVGLVAPVTTPRRAVDALSRAVAAAVREPSVAHVFADSGVLACGSSPEEFGAFIQNETARWGPIVARFKETKEDPTS
jgi:tripartite-type tricarboxylate transporter receptor subunit TctC